MTTTITCEVCRDRPADVRCEATDASPETVRCYDCARSTAGACAPLGQYRDTDEAVRVLTDAGVPAINHHSGGGVMLAEVRLSPNTNGAPHIWIHDSSEQGETEGLWSPGFYLRDDDEGDTIVAHNLTDGQLVGLCQQARVYYTDDAPNCVGLVSVKGYRGYYMGNIPNGHVAFAFTYLYEDGRAGLEVTVYDADGDVTDSQDFG